LHRDEAFRSKLSAIKKEFAKAGIAWAIFAGVAAYCYGSRRKITDIDILVKGEDLGRAKATIKDIIAEGVDVIADLEIKTKQGICYFFMDEEMVKRIQWKELFGITVPIIPVEDNIVFKAILQRGEDQGKHNVEDMQQMIKNQKIDLEYLRKRIRKYQAEKR